MGRAQLGDWSLGEGDIIGLVEDEGEVLIRVSWTVPVAAIGRGDSFSVSCLQICRPCCECDRTSGGAMMRKTEVVDEIGVEILGHLIKPSARIIRECNQTKS